MAKIGEWKWLIGSNLHGIPKPFIDEMVKSCRGCKFGQQNIHTSGEGLFLDNIRNITKFQLLKMRSL